MLCPVLLLAFFAAAQGRAVNISNTWVLPEEGFPVFYRYFRDRISWYEADAVCQFHHANLVTVDTTAQYDAVRAYLKELDISSTVWVGLIRSNTEGEFTWTDYRGLSGGGYWSAAPDARAAPLCAAADPAADYRWEARGCGGPTVASFICELPVPQWALGNQGCMVKALPALTVLYLPESAAVQLTADCGLAGTKQVQCTGNVKHEDLLRNLSCAEEDETSNTSVTLVSASSSSLLSDTSFSEQDLTSEVTTEELNITTEPVNVSEARDVNSSHASLIVKTEETPQQKQDVLNKFRGMYTQKNINIELTHNNNLQSNDIPTLAKNENVLTLEESEKLEDEKNMQHKLLHDELARHGNFETIFSQPTDHFVPPLVMAKAKISDDMTVLSLAEKHAQQLAEQRLAKHKLPEYYSETPRSTTEEPNNVEIIEKPLVMTMQPTKSKYTGKKDKTKQGVPKKYSEKSIDPKSKNIKIIESKLQKNVKPMENLKTLPQMDTELKTTIKTTHFDMEDDSSIDLTVMLKELGVNNSRVSRYSNLSNTVPKEPKIQVNVTLAPDSFPDISSYENVNTKKNPELEAKIPLTVDHEVVNVTIIDYDNKSNSTTKMFETTTGIPEYTDENKKKSELTNFSTLLPMTVDEHRNNISEIISTIAAITIKSESVTDAVSTTKQDKNSEPAPAEVSSTVKSEIVDFDKIKSKQAITNTTFNTKLRVIQDNTTEDTIQVSTEVILTNASETSEPKSENQDVDGSNTTAETFNVTVQHEEDFMKVSNTSFEFNDDFQSPLLSGANEPVHRPNRLRRPVQPPSHMKKFNPFRILG